MCGASENFDTIPEQFDLYRSRYCDELFADLISVAEIGPAKTVLELGPGTGQATEPVLRTGCSYSALSWASIWHRSSVKNMEPFRSFI